MVDKTQTDYLQWNVPIVDKNCLPTPQFIRFFQQHTNNISGAVPSTRRVDTGAGLTGGGDLSADRTISYDGSLAEQSDVDLSIAPTDGQVLTWVDADSKWEAQDSEGGSSSPLWVTTATGTGASQNITIPAIPPNKQSLLITVNGIRFHTSDYSYSGTIVTLTTNASGDLIEIVGVLGGIVAPPVSGHQYWRVLGTINNIWEMAYYVGPTDVSTDPSLATASSEFDGSHGPDKAFDGNLSTLWGAGGSGTQWVQYSFTTPEDVDSVQFSIRDGFSPGVQIQYSDDNSTWTTKWTIGTIPGGSPGPWYVVDDSGTNPV